jgi:type IV secretion system protein VirB10
MRRYFVLLLTGALYSVNAQQEPALQPADNIKPGNYVLDSGIKVPLTLLNTISSKQAAEGDRVYLETMFPVMVNGKIVIPPGSYVAGTVSQVKRPGRIKGKGELYLRFDSLTLPNGVVRDFRARIGGMDGGGDNELDRDEGKIKGGGNKGEDARNIGQAAQMGTMVGGIAGAVSGRPVAGIAGGAAGGAAAGLAGVLLTRGPDVVLPKGSMVEMVLDRPLQFEERELNFIADAQYQPVRTLAPAAAPAETKRSTRGWPFPF